MLKSLKRKIAVILCIAMIVPNNLSNLSFVFADEIGEDTLSTRSSIVSTGTDSDMDDDYVFDEELSDEEDDGSNTYYEEEPEEDVVEDSMITENDDTEEEENKPEEESEDVEIATISELDEEVEDMDEIFDTEAEEDKVSTPSEPDIEDEVVDDEITATISETTSCEDSTATPSEANSLLFGITDIASDSETNYQFGLGYISPDFVPEIAQNKNDKLLFGAGDIPAAYDARNDKNPANPSMSVVPPIRDQGRYGMCWAFSTIAMLETSIRKQGLVTTEEDSDLSEAAMAYFNYNLDRIYSNSANMDVPGLEGKDYIKLPAGSQAWYAIGGNQKIASTFLSSFMGAPVEDSVVGYDCIPNMISNGLDGQYAYHKNKFTVKNVKYINKNDTDAIKRAIMQNGSVGISYASLGGSVLIGRYMNRIGNERYYLTDGKYQADHAVVIVGWDDNISHTNFGYGTPGEGYYTTTDVDGAWLVRNSWGPDGNGLLNEGYFWMSYAEPSLGSDIYTIEAMKADTYKYNYHYDTFSLASRAVGKAGNVFKVMGDENQVLSAVSLCMSKANQNFNIKVYTKATAMANPEDGTLCLTQAVSTAEGGIHTIPLNNSVPLALGTYYSIILEEVGSEVWIDTASSQILNIANIQDYYNMVSEGQSYVYNGGWNDCNAGLHDSYSQEWNVHNYSIKGLTNPGSGIGFNANGGTGTMSRLDGEKGTDVTIPANAFVREGYVFDKWTTEADGSGTEYHENDTITIPTEGAITLYAQWTPIHYNLKLNPNGQTGTETSVSYAYDEEVNLANPSFTSVDYTFGGWQTTQGNAEKVYDEGQTGVKGLVSTDGADYTLYAHWLPGAYKVRFNANGGDGSMSLQNITIDESTALTSNAFTKQGYTFTNWNTEANGSGTTYTNGQSVLNLAAKDETFDLYAQWTPITYTIVYNANSGSITPTSKTKTYGTDVTLDTPTKDGHTFEGWFSDEALSSSYDGSTDICTVQGQSVNIYAKWSANTYTIQFDVGDHATAPASVTKTYGQNVTLPEPTNPESGYLFVGWYKEASLTNVYTGSEDLSMTQGDTKIVYAKWKQQIIFNANGHGTNPPSMDVTTSAITLPNITCDGYIFGGWYEEAGCTTFAGNAGDTYTVTGPKTLYAKWTAITYTIKYNNITGSSIEESDTITKTYGTNVTLGSPTKTGYTFDSWYSNAGLTTSYDGTTDLTIVNNATVNIYAKWNAITYTITYNTAGHGTAPANTTKMYETNYSVPNPTNIVTGYTFLGWFSDNALTTPYDGTTDLTTTQGDTKTLYSKWKAKVSFVANGQGVAPASVDVVLGESTTLPAIEGVTGYAFGGWYNEAACSSFVGNGDSSYTVNEVKTLYAKWTLKDGYVEAKYETNGGSSINSQAVLSGGTFTRPSNPSKAGFTFDNWYKESALVNAYDFSSVATQSIILYAKWNQVVNISVSSRSRSSSSSGGGNTGVYVGPLAKELANRDVPKQENAKQVASRTVDIVVSLENINWQTNAVTGAIKLGLDKNDPSKVAKDGFYAIPSFDALGNAKNDVYNFDSEGNMVTGWAKDAEGKMYFFETDQGQNQGKMLSNAWKEVGEGKWYYFASDGKMMTNGVTPDGYIVGADGLWQ